ncbi:MAG TPA: septation protein A [Chitinispirillaceae bacterium]|nr:septation protein A [Chitinispirillaceae bacterium]
MKLLFDFFPVLLFFAVFKLKGIFAATMAAIIASVFQIGWMLFKRKKVEPMMWLSLAIIVLFGGATLLFKNEDFIKLKPSILYWLFSIGLLGGQFIFKKNGIKSLLGKQMELPEKTWAGLNASWGIFFACVGGINLYVANYFSTDTWVNFKLFGIMGLLLAFSLAQGVVISMKMNKTK